MNSILPALLGLTLMLSRGQALICQSGTYETVRETSEPPLEWTVGAEFCMDGWGCQDSLMLVENGPQVLLILTKGCTPKEDHEARVTQHRKGPGLSVVSYTRVCRHQNFCNDLTTSLPVWSLPTSAVPGSVRCPVCFGEEDCESAVEVTCPFGHNHCYNGTLQIRGDGIFTDLKVQGCMSQRACNLLNETREIGALSVNEKCDSVARLICDMGIMLQMKEDLAQNPLPWDTFLNVTCDLNEVCQETLLLIDVGPKSLMVGSKGCSKTETQNSTTISIHLAPPGVLVASYAHFCSSNGCNRATSSSVLLNSLPRPAVPAPGDLQCPACVHFRGSCSNSVNVTCPRGTTHCYNNDLNLQGGGVSAVFSIQGCVAQPSSSLLKHTKNIGQFIAPGQPGILPLPTCDTSKTQPDWPEMGESTYKLFCLPSWVRQLQIGPPKISDTSPSSPPKGISISDSTDQGQSCAMPTQGRKPMTQFFGATGQQSFFPRAPQPSAPGKVLPGAAFKQLFRKARPSYNPGSC